MIKIASVDKINRLINETIREEKCDHLDIYSCYKKKERFLTIINFFVAACIYMYGFYLHNEISINVTFELLVFFVGLALLWFLVGLPIHETIHVIMTPKKLKYTYVVFSPPITLSTVSLCWMSKKRTLLFLIMPFLIIQSLLTLLIFISSDSPMHYLVFLYFSYMNLFSAEGDLFSAIYILRKLHYDCEFLGMYVRRQQ